MVRSSSSCFKIITCGAARDSDEDLEEVESKASSDKRRWSFRKRSTRHRVLSNSVISEPLSFSYNKEILEGSTNNCYSPINSSIPEKPHLQESQFVTPPLSSSVVSSSVAETLPTTKYSTPVDNDLLDSVAIVIQAAIRGYLARGELRKLQNVIKLQAAVRGHLVRRQAVGTLRCIRAIIKMQTILRARYARQLVERLADQENGNHKIDNQLSSPLAKRNTSTKPKEPCVSTEKLLSNGFARQLLLSTPKTKHISIKCDPSTTDSAWKWLERWMVVASSRPGELHDHQGYQGQEEDAELAFYDTTSRVPDEVASVSADKKLIEAELAKSTEDGLSLVTEASGGIELQASLKGHVKDQSQHDDVISSAAEGNPEKMLRGGSDSVFGQTLLESDATSKSVIDSVHDTSETDRSPKLTAKRLPCEPVEAEGKRFALGPRKACNPAFVAAQSKFEELSSTHTIGRRVKSMSIDASSDSKVDSMNTQADSLSNTKNHSIIENSESHDPRLQVAASECGTEISVTSTLDSPERSEAEGGEIILEIGSLEAKNYNLNGGADDVIYENVNSEGKNSSLEPELHQLQEFDHDDKTLATSLPAAAHMQTEMPHIEGTTSDVQAQMENPVDQVYRSSPEASPRSHATAPESHGTPSSQLSVHAKKSQRDSLPTRKPRSRAAAKRSPSNLNNDSGGRCSTENLIRDAKNAKRRNLSVIKPDNADHEHRISSSSALPSYMQATESARAKAYTCISPKSSPDVHDKDYPKKRHSLPIANGKQGSSPRMQRSASQAQQNSKGNETHSPHNSAERRWQR